MGEKEKIKELEYRISVLQSVVLTILTHLDSEILVSEIHGILDYMKDTSKKNVAAFSAIDDFQVMLQSDFE